MRFLKSFPAAVGTVLGLSLLEAIVWVWMNDGMGSGDLLPFVLWSMPLGLLVAPVSYLLRGVSSRYLRTAASLAAGVLLGYGWTLAMAKMMGPWFGTFSFPVLPIFLLAASATLVFFSLRKRWVDPVIRT